MTDREPQSKQARNSPTLQSESLDNENYTLSKRFMSLYRGYEHAHGQHDLSETPDENGKMKGRASTRPGGATEVEYLKHLQGFGPSLGVIPLLGDDRCAFGAIDIDIQGEVRLNETVEELEARVRKFNLPLVVCRSKSGGAHLYVFASEPLPARLVQSKLREMAALLGYAGCEIFPKQVMRVNVSDRGNWINIPYFGVLQTPGTSRYAVNLGKQLLDLEEFLKHAESMQVCSKDFTQGICEASEKFHDGPPCLQHLAQVGVESGNRNTTLLNVAIYYKLSAPARWEDLMVEFNYRCITPL